MKNLIIFSVLICMMVVNFSSCQPAKERPSKLNKNIESKVIAIDELADMTIAENQDSEANVSFKRLLIAKMTDAEKRNHAELLLSQNRLAFQLLEGKVVVVEVLTDSNNKHSEAASGSVEVAPQSRFIVLAEIGITTGILENEMTDYDEKKSTLKLTETTLDNAEYLILKEEIKADASGGD